MADLSKFKVKDAAKRWSERPVKPKVDKTPERRRNGMLKQIDAIVAGAKPRGWMFERNGLVACSLRSGSREVKFDGGETIKLNKSKFIWGFFVEPGAVVDFYREMRADVANGALDNQIAAAWGDKKPNLLRELENGRGKKRATKGRAMDPEKVYQRNVQRYGKERADALRAAKQSK